MKNIIIYAVCIVFFATNVANCYWNRVQTPLNGTYWLDCYFVDAKHGWICGKNNRIIYTNDSGNTWHASNILPRGGYFYESIHFIDSSNGFLSGPDGVYLSNDGGINWRSVDLFMDNAISTWGCLMLSADTLFVVGGGCENDPNRLIWRTIDSGNTWTYTNLSQYSIPIYENDYYSGLTDIIFAKNSNCLYAISSGIIWRSNDFGMNWSFFAQNQPYFAWNEEICNIDGTNIFLCPYSGTSCSGNYGPNDNVGGMLWTNNALNGSYFNKFQVNAPMFGAFLLSDTKGWAVGYYKNIWRTSDAGSNWTLDNCGVLDNDALDDIFFINDTLGWVVGTNVYKYSKNNIMFSSNFPPNRINCAANEYFDTVFVANRTQNIAVLDLRITENNQYYSIISPTTLYSNMSACEITPIIIKFAPDVATTGSHSFKFSANAHSIGSPDDYFEEFEIINTIRSTNVLTDRDTIDLGELLIGSVGKDFVLFYSEIADTITKITPNSPILQADSIVFLSPYQNIPLNFTINALDTGNFLLPVSFLLTPCNEIKTLYVKFSVVAPFIDINGDFNIACNCQNDTLVPIILTNIGSSPIVISEMTIDDPKNMVFAPYFGTDRHNFVIIIEPNKKDTLFVALHSAKSDTSSINIMLHGNLIGMNIVLNVAFKTKNETKIEKNIPFGEVFVTSVQEITLDIEKNTLFKAPKPPFYYENETIIFAPTKRGSFIDTCIFLIEPCDSELMVILTGKGLDTTNKHPKPIKFEPPIHHTELPIDKNDTDSVKIDTSRIKKELPYKGWTPLVTSSDTIVDKIDTFVVYFDTTNAEVGERITITGFLKGKNKSLIITGLAFGIEIDWDLFNLEACYYVNGAGDAISLPFAFKYPLNIEFELSDSAFFGQSRAFLQLVGTTLLSSKSKSAVSFTHFDVNGAKKELVVNKIDGALDLFDVCGGDYRGNVVFGASYDAKILQQVVENELHIEFTATGDIEIDADVIDLLGHCLKSLSFSIKKGVSERVIPLDGLAKGVYFISLSSGYYPPIINEVIKR
jgi:photosystem II stability/assembly factor-like uncharacterized protein